MKQPRKPRIPLTPNARSRLKSRLAYMSVVHKPLTAENSRKRKRRIDSDCDEVHHSKGESESDSCDEETASEEGSQPDARDDAVFERDVNSASPKGNVPEPKIGKGSKENPILLLDDSDDDSE
jgi:hypothetical protein